MSGEEESAIGVVTGVGSDTETPPVLIPEPVKLQSHPPSKLDSLPRDELVRLLRKQTLALKEAKKVGDEQRERANKLEDELAKAVASTPSNELITFELNDYKNSCQALKKQLEKEKEAQVQKDELVRDLTNRNDELLRLNAEAGEHLREARQQATKREKEVAEHKILVEENSKEAQSLALQAQQIRAEYDLEIAQLTSKVKLHREESEHYQRLSGDRGSEIRRLRGELDLLQRRFDDLQTEHATFKERAEYALKLRIPDASEGADSGRHEIDELIRSLRSRNDKIAQITERCSFLEEELRSTQYHAQNLKTELEDATATLSTLRTRSMDEKRRVESDFEFRLRQALTDKDILQKQLSRTIEQFSAEKEKLAQNFDTQTAELVEQNKALQTRVEEYRALALNIPDSVPSTPATAAVSSVRLSLSGPTASSNSTFRRPIEPPINFSAPRFDSQPGLAYENDEDDLRSLADVIATRPDQLDPRRVGQSLGDHLLYSRTSNDAFVSIEDYDSVNKQLDHTRDLLNDMEDTNAKLAEQVKILKEEIRRLERNLERQEHAKNSEYLKNVVMKYLAPPKVNDERQQLLPVLTTMLRLSPEEIASIKAFIEGSQNSMIAGDDNSTQGWSSYLWNGLS